MWDRALFAAETFYQITLTLNKNTIKIGQIFVRLCPFQKQKVLFHSSFLQKCANIFYNILVEVHPAYSDCRFRRFCIFFNKMKCLVILFLMKLYAHTHEFFKIVSGWYSWLSERGSSHEWVLSHKIHLRFT